MEIPQPHSGASQRDVPSSATIRQVDGLNALRPTLANGLPYRDAVLSLRFGSTGVQDFFFIFHG